MRNYSEKERDMCRSILPSTRRVNARRSAETIKRYNRRTTRKTLRAWAAYDDPFDFEGFANTDTNRARHYDDMITYVMWERRGADKSAPLQRWAERLCETKLKDMDGEDRRAYFKGLLPSNLIGRHAMSHLDHLFPDENPYPDYTFTRTSRGEYRAQNKASREALVAEFAERVYAAVVTDHKGLNRCLTGLAAPVLGLHDVEAFASRHVHTEKVKTVVEGMCADVG